MGGLAVAATVYFGAQFVAVIRSQKFGIPVPDSTGIGWKTSQQINDRHLFRAGPRASGFTKGIAYMLFWPSLLFLFAIAVGPFALDHLLHVLNVQSLSVPHLALGHTRFHGRRKERLALARFFRVCSFYSWARA